MIKIEIVNEKTGYDLIENVNIKDKEYENEYIVTIPSFTKIKNAQDYYSIYDIDMIDSDVDSEGYETISIKLKEGKTPIDVKLVLE